MQWNWRLTPEIFFGDYLYKAVLAEKVTGEKGKFYFSADKLTEFLQITVRREGEYFEKFGGGPTGLETLAATINEDANTIEDVYEPYLLQLGFIARTPRGRICLKDGYAHMGLQPTMKARKQMSIFEFDN